MWFYRSACTQLMRLLGIRVLFDAREVFVSWRRDLSVLVLGERSAFELRVRIRDTDTARVLTSRLVHLRTLSSVGTPFPRKTCIASLRDVSGASLPSSWPFSRRLQG